MCRQGRQTHGQNCLLHPRCHLHSRTQTMEGLARLGWRHFPTAFRTTSCTFRFVCTHQQSLLFSHYLIHRQYIAQPSNRGRSGKWFVSGADASGPALTPVCLSAVSLAIYLELEKMGLRCWVDPRSPVPGV